MSRRVVDTTFALAVTPPHLIVKLKPRLDSLSNDDRVYSGAHLQGLGAASKTMFTTTLGVVATKTLQIDLSLSVLPRWPRDLPIRQVPAGMSLVARSTGPTPAACPVRETPMPRDFWTQETRRTG